MAPLIVISLLTMAIAACGDDDDAAPARVIERGAPAATATGAPATATAAATATPAPQATGAPTPAPTAVAVQQAVRTATPAPTAAHVQGASGAPTPAPAPARRATTEPTPQQPGPPATTFKNYGRSPFVDAHEDAVSTFSLDTDRTSYFLALSWARNGYAVEPDSVRAEEWINAFAYGYDQPVHERSFAISSEVVEHPLGGGRHLARIAFQAPELRDDTPLNVTLVLDASGSMREGNRVAIAREAAETIRQSLGSRDRIAVVHFTSDVIDAYTVEHSRPDDRDVVRSIARLDPHASTNVQAGLNVGVRLADEARRDRPNAYNYIILMSDGVANVDATSPFAILESAPDFDRRNPLRLITIGVGIANYNDYLLEQLAQHGNGWYRYLDDTAQARDTFSRENWLALSTPFADQARAQVTWDPRLVEAWRIVGYENRITPDHTFEQNRKEFAELPSGSATTVFYELVLSERGRNPSAVLGAIVALVADRYSALSPQIDSVGVGAGGIYSDIAALRDEFYPLEERLGSAEAYQDFGFLLEHLAAAIEEVAPSTGYSR